jgi:hypothetical protein
LGSRDDLLRTLSGDADARAGLFEAVRGLPGVVRSRRVVRPDVESKLRMLNRKPFKQEMAKGELRRVPYENVTDLP